MNISTDGMTFKEIVLTGGALIVMAIGVAGVILPILPGLPLVWVGAFLYAHFTGYAVIDKTYLINFGLAAGGLVILEYIFKAFGAKKMGASKWGMIGAFIGMIVGVSMGSLWAMILGPLVGATLFEMMLGRRLMESMRAGCGTFIAFLIGTILQVALGLMMIGVFLTKTVLK